MSQITSVIIFFILFLNCNLFASEFLISEAALKALGEKGAPKIEQIESVFLGADLKKNEIEQKYAPEFFGKTSFSETNEKAINQFQPVFTPIKQFQLGVRQNYQVGIDTSVYLVTDQRSAVNPFIGRMNNLTTSTMAFTAQIDLWKNIFGRISKAEVESLDLELQRAEIEKEIQLKTFMISLRRLYWSLVANNESSSISEELLKTARRQLVEAKLRQKNAVAEADEVARYEAQLASREGTLLYLKYQKENYLKQLRNLLPELTHKKIKFSPYNLDETIGNVLECTAIISQQNKTPFHFTKYDEMTSMLKKIRSNLAKINSRYDDADVKLFGTVKTTGVASELVKTKKYQGSYGDSFEEHTLQNRTGYEVGINFSIPLGSSKGNTQKVKELYDHKRLSAIAESTDAQVESTHLQLSKSIQILTQVIESQKNSSEQLSKRLKLIQRKYEQARVSVDQLVLDQDALLNSKLMTNDTKLQVLYILFDYLIIFTDTPCSFNRI